MLHELLHRARVGRQPGGRVVHLRDKLLILLRRQLRQQRRDLLETLDWPREERGLELRAGHAQNADVARLGQRGDVGLLRGEAREVIAEGVERARAGEDLRAVLPVNITLEPQDLPILVQEILNWWTCQQSRSKVPDSSNISAG